ncbi:PIN domain-containing protein [Limnobacter sp.]|uniref:PIN domain-containing protein n=1 Tax=Limnobacter sp. TaxID=2003368 RepID=UPI00352328F2
MFGGILRTNYVLIDYENVQPEAMSALNKEHFKVIVFVGANQAKVTFEVASVLQHIKYGFPDATM